MADFNFVTNRVATGAAITDENDVNQLVAAGINYVIDCRAEFDDGALLASHPGIHYLNLGVQDDGQPKPTSWFQQGIEFALDALSKPHNSVYSHCACFLPDTVVGNFNPTKIQNMPDNVVSHDGSQHTVTGFMAKQHHDTIRSIQARGIPTLNCTPEHPFLVLRPYRSKSGRIFTPNIVPYFPAVESHYLNLEPEWVIADDLQVGDYLLSPKLLFEQKEFVPELIRNSPRSQEFAIGPDFAWLIGLYAGDGSAGNKGVNWTLSKKNNLSRFYDALRFMEYPYTTYEYENHCRTFVYSAIARDTFRAWCGVADTKHLPDLVFSNPHVANLALQGLMESDGCITSDGRAHFVNTSPTLAWQVWHLAIANGFTPYLSYRKPSQAITHITGKEVKKRKPTYSVHWSISPKKATNKITFWDNFYATPVKEIVTSPYNGPVYNMEVEGTNSYLANGVIAHNCGINRGPSMCYAVLLAQGLDVNTAENLIRARRPQVGLAYKQDAIRAVKELGYADNSYQSVLGEIER